MSDKPTHWEWMEAAREIRDSRTEAPEPGSLSAQLAAELGAAKAMTQSMTGPRKPNNGASVLCSARSGNGFCSNTIRPASRGCITGCAASSMIA